MIQILIFAETCYCLGFERFAKIGTKRLTQNGLMRRSHHLHHLWDHKRHRVLIIVGCFLKEVIWQKIF